MTGRDDIATLSWTWNAHPLFLDIKIGPVPDIDRNRLDGLCLRMTEAHEQRGGLLAIGKFNGGGDITGVDAAFHREGKRAVVSRRAPHLDALAAFQPRARRSQGERQNVVVASLDQPVAIQLDPRAGRAPSNATEATGRCPRRSDTRL